jgi:hypothetical protein
MTLADGVQLVAAVAAAASGVLLLVRGSTPGTGWLLVATALAIPPVAVGVPTASATFTLSLVVVGAGGPLAAVLAAVAGVVWPAAALRAVDRAVVAVALACVGLVGGVLPALVFDPVAAGCNACPRNLVEVYGSAPAADLLARAATWLTLLWGPALALLAAARWLQAPALARRSAWPMLGGGAGVALLSAVSAVYGLRLPVGQVDGVVRSIWLAQCVLVVVIAAGVAVRLYLVRTAGPRMARARRHPGSAGGDRVAAAGRRRPGADRLLLPGGPHSGRS